MSSDLAEQKHPYSLLAPGPVNLHPQVRQILAEPMIHHRTPEFDRIFKKTKQQLQFIFQTQQEVFIHTSTGSGGMESLIVNTLNAGDEVLAIISGKFGERWAEMAEFFGAQVHRLNIPWGEAVKPQVVQDFLQKNKNIKAVLCQACETSSAVAHPIEELGLVVRQHAETLFLVDGITALGAYNLPMDAWFIDGLVGGSQKAFMLPTGLSFVCFSPKAWRKIDQVKTPRFYFDIRREKKSNLAGETFFSSSVTLIKALGWVLDHIQSIGLDQHFKIIASRAKATRDFFTAQGFKLYSQSPSDSLTAVCMPGAVNGQEVRQKLEAERNITLMGGQDQAKGKILRIGHMGYITRAEMKNLFISTLEIISQMQNLKVDSIELKAQAEKYAAGIIEVK